MLKSGEQIGDWIIEEVLGEGGMGAVYRCRNVMSDRIEAAVKVIKPHSLADEKERFIREVEALDALRHPSVVRVKGWGQDPQRGLLWLAMDMVRGDDLERHLAEHGAIGVERARGLFASIADGLDHAHARGIFHRDIKPANIILCDDGTARTVDFGIAVQQGRTRLTAMGMIPGTPGYMAPEIFQGDRPEPVKLDVYALGLVFYEAIAGKWAFPEEGEALSTGQRLVQLMGKKLQSEPFDPGPRFPDDLRALIGRATEPDPAKRLPDMASFVEGLTGQPSPGRRGLVPDAGNRPDSGGARSTIDLDVGAVAEPSQTEWVPNGRREPTPRPEPRPEPEPRQERAPPPRAAPRSGAAVVGFGALGVGMLGVLGAGVLVLLGAAVVAAYVLLQPEVAATRDVRVSITGVPADVPLRATLGGMEPFSREGASFDFREVEPGLTHVWVAAGQCDEAWPDGACGACCSCTREPVEVVAGTGSQLLAAELPPPPAPEPRPVRITAPDVGSAWTVAFDLGGASGPSGERVDAHTKRYETVPLGAYELLAEAGRCAASDRGCAVTGSCPDGCSSWVETVEVPCGTGEHVVEIGLPAPKAAAVRPAPAPAPTPTPTPAPAPAPSTSACSASCPSGAFTGAHLPPGTQVEILGVHTEDAFCDSAASLKGVVGTTGEMTHNGGCWYGGEFTGSDGSYLYFFKAAVREVRGAPAPAADSRYTGEAIEAGRRFRIVDVHTEDAYHSMREILTGMTCVSEDTLPATAPGWFGGAVYCTDQQSYYFFKVAVEML